MKAICTFAAAGIALSAQGQSLDFLVAPTGIGSQWSISATLSNPTGTIVAIISDLGFRLTGFEVRNFQYNPAFDSTFFGPATVNISGNTIEFYGTNTLPPLNNAGGPDGSNPLQIATFDLVSYGNWFDNSLELLGQVTGAYSGAPFPDVFFYQYADGSPGEVEWNAGFIPAPATGSLVALAGFAAMRRRR